MMSKVTRPGAEPVQKAAMGKDPNTHHNTGVEKRQGKQPSVVSRKQAGLKGNSPVSLQPEKTRSPRCKQLCHVGDGQKCAVLHNRKVEARSGAAQRAARAKSLEAHHCHAHIKECSRCEHEAYEADSESQPKKRVRKHKPAKTSPQAEVRDSGYESKSAEVSLEQTAKRSRRNLKRAQVEIDARTHFKYATEVLRHKPTVRLPAANNYAEAVLRAVDANSEKFVSAGPLTVASATKVASDNLIGCASNKSDGESGSLLTAGKAAGKSGDSDVAAYSRLMEESMKAEVAAAKEQVLDLQLQVKNVKALRAEDAKNTVELREKLLAETEAKLAEIRLKHEESLKETIERVKLEQEERDRVVREGFALEMAKQSEEFTLKLEAERKLRADEQVARKEQFDLAREERQVVRRQIEKEQDRAFTKEIQWMTKEIKVWRLLRLTGTFPQTDGLLVKVRMAKERRQAISDSEREILSSIKNVSEAASASTSVGGGFFFTVAVGANKSWSSSHKEGKDHIRSQLREDVVTMRTEGDLTGVVRKIGTEYYLAFDEFPILVSSVLVAGEVHNHLIMVEGEPDYHQVARTGGFYYHRSASVLNSYAEYLGNHSVEQKATIYKCVGAYETYDALAHSNIWGHEEIPALEINNDRALKRDF